MIRIRILEKKKVLIVAEEAYAQMDQLVGMFLTGLSGFGARIGGRDLAVRRAIDQAVFDLRREISEAATKLADECGEPVSWMPTHDDRRDDRRGSRGIRSSAPTASLPSSAR